MTIQKLICQASTANMMEQASHKCELLTQLFYNDKAELLEEKGVWIKIKNKFNGTVGWVLNAQFAYISEDQYAVNAETICFVNECSIELNEVSTKIVPGTFFYEEENSVAVFKGEIKSLDTFVRDETTISTILYSYLNVPYVWGGITHAGIDCSGLSQILYRFFNIPLTSFATEQVEHGITLDFLQDARCGDLAFFHEPDGHISHVGILLNAHEIIHATESAGKVVIDNIDHEGIVSKLNGKRTHTLRLIKRL